MNEETIDRLHRHELELDFQNRQAEAVQVYRLRMVAQSSERLTRATLERAKWIIDAKKHGSTLRELAEVSGLSIEGVRQIIQKGKP
jgi:DNA-directed RNA polymerase sigma subunit (sigma70/sigma32)